MDNPYRSPEASDSAPTPPAPDWRARKAVALAAMMGVAAVAGFLRRGPLSVVDVATVLAFAGLLLRWLDYDAAERGSETSRLFAVLVVTCPGPLVMLPAYLWQTREGAGKPLAVALFAGVAILVVVAWIAGAAVAAATR